MISRMNRSTRRLLFLLFFLSGFCSLVYQVIWTRMAFASFGIITPVLSVVLSVFMLGLAVGSWAAGRLIGPWTKATGWSAAYFYAGAELTIGLGGAFGVPRLFRLGEHCLLAAGQTNSFDYLFWSALVLAVSIFPWCVFMGSTFPLMMAFVRERDERNQESFSYLYLANVLGAMSGTLWTALISIEILGFHLTLLDAAAGNCIIAAIGVLLGRSRRPATVPSTPTAAEENRPVMVPPFQQVPGRLVQWLLFSTGFVSMAMEVIWTRAFTPVLQTQVYAFASIICVYLGATFFGSWRYRRDLRNGRVRALATLIFLLALTALLPAVINDYRIVQAAWGELRPVSALILLASICPFCATLGYLTPGLIDGYATGRPAEAGKAYAINVIGCILGPLAASYGLLPWINERSALILLSLPFLGYYWWVSKPLPPLHRWGGGLIVGATLVWVAFGTLDFEKSIVRVHPGPSTVIRRDYAASTISVAGQMGDKHLLVNGVGMTVLTPITKFMAHLPLAYHQGPPQSVLIICFGMGTTYRSALSWNIDTTAVELVPGVTKAFGFYHADAPRCLSNPRGHIVIDDGRRFLNRTQEKFDVIIIDPPPPPQAAGSSLLYSTKFYELVKAHLQPHGILQTWVPGYDISLIQGVVRSVCDSFPHTQCFAPVQGVGLHVLASMDPIPPLNGTQLAAKMPDSAKQDLLEWSDIPDAAKYIDRVIAKGTAATNLLNPDPEIAITDDRPYNEYYLLRTWKLF